jgi:uncharacterized membrane protein YuzA (DUF378 family)
MDWTRHVRWFTLAVLVTVGLNIGLTGIGMFNGGEYNVLNTLFGELYGGQIEAGIYILTGLSALYQLYLGYAEAVRDHM